ncbi:11496_t:CDS:2 [Entrophospora sp. SA101]|nr:11496_t:CDS:2 [Entrophospora sp. SA101]
MAINKLESNTIEVAKVIEVEELSAAPDLEELLFVAVTFCGINFKPFLPTSTVTLFALIVIVKAPANITNNTIKAR